MKLMSDLMVIIYFLIHFQVIDHYENPRNVGTLDKDDDSVGTGLVGAPACGDVMKLQVELLNGSSLITQTLSQWSLELVTQNYILSNTYGVILPKDKICSVSFVVPH